MGKQRQAFGSYLVVNKDTQQFSIYGYTYTDSDNTAWSNIYEPTKEDSVQFLGSHELYWWPYLEFLLARLRDGSSFKFFRFNTNFQTTAATINGGGSATVKEDIDYTEHRLWSVPGRLTVPPVFWGKLAYFYTSDSDSSAYLRVYEYNPILKAPELKCITSAFTETS